jgi:predicted transcriptional regulator
MPRKRSKTLTEAELRLMEILWVKGRSTVGDVVESLPKAAPLAYTTVLTTLRILEQKGFVRHTKQGRAFTYQPIVDRDQVRSDILKRVVGLFFNNSRELLVVKMLEDGKIDANELKRLKKLIEEGE